MARSDWLRTFIAIYRTRSITEAARFRGISQSAASQQLIGLEKAIGTSLFVRNSLGVEPTESGKSLYFQTAQALDKIEMVLADLETGTIKSNDLTIRIGTTAEFFSAVVLDKVAKTDLKVIARFGQESELIELLEQGELDLVIVSTNPIKKSITSTLIDQTSFVLVANKVLFPKNQLSSIEQLYGWVHQKSWLSYSLELPITRKFWQTAFSVPFNANVVFVAPDLRAVLESVEKGMGISLLPTYICSQSLSLGKIKQIFPVGKLVPSQYWFGCMRQVDTNRMHIQSFLELLKTKNL